MDDVKQYNKDHCAEDRALQRQAGSYPAANRQQRQPEHRIADPAERCANGDFGTLNAVDILLGALHRQNDADNKRHQKGMSIEESHMAFHGAGQIAFIGVDFFQCGQ